MRESSVERRCAAWAKDRGEMLLKLAPTSAIGMPDRLYIRPNRPLVFVEFKAAGGVVSPAQRAMHKRLHDIGQPVWIVWTFEAFKEMACL